MSDKQQYYATLDSNLKTLTERTISGIDTQDSLRAQWQARQLYAQALLNRDIEPIEFLAGMPLHRLDNIARGSIADRASGSIAGTGQAARNALVGGLTSLTNIPATLTAVADKIKKEMPDAASDPLNYLGGMTMRERAELAAIYQSSPDLNAALADRTQSKTIGAYFMTQGAATGARTATSALNYATEAAAKLTGPDLLAVTAEGTILPVANTVAAKGSPGMGAPMSAMVSAAVAASPKSTATSAATSPAEKHSGGEKAYALRDTAEGANVWAIVRNVPRSNGIREVNIYQAKLHEYGSASLPDQPPVITARYHVVKGFDHAFTDQVAPVELRIWLKKEKVLPTASVEDSLIIKTHLTALEVKSLLQAHLNDVLTAIRKDAEVQSGRPYVQAISLHDEVIKGGRIGEKPWHRHLGESGLDGHDKLIRQLNEANNKSISSLEPEAATLSPQQTINNQITLRALQNGLEPNAVMAKIQTAMATAQAGHSQHTAALEA